MKSRIALLATICFAVSAHAAHSPGLAPTGRVAMATTKASLELPIIERLQDLRAQGAAGYKNLTAIMFDRSIAMQTRWKAVTAAGRVAGEASRKDLEHALKSEEWFMRNAGLIAMLQLDRNEGLKWARKLMSDKALVVRSAAVDSIENARDTASTSLLWEKLYAKENFKRGQSLFIRRRIVEVLANMETPGRESKFVAVLGDKDSDLHAPAINALERLTHKKMGQPNEPVAFQKAKWEKWWKESRSL